MNSSMAASAHVTICVPAFNAERTLRRTLDSILAQDYPDFDVLICDNASTDNTAQIAGEYASRNVRYVFNPARNRLAERNWNYALRFTQGPLIALYHADDIYTPTMVRRQVEFIQTHTDVSAVFTKTRMINEQDRPIRLGTVLQPKALRGQECFAFPILFNAVLKYRNFLTVPTLMTKKEALDAVGMFDLRFRSAADIDLWFRLSRLGSVGVINEPLHYYRISAQQGSAQIDQGRTEIADFFRVIDNYLTRPEVVKIVKSDALAYYEIDRAIDSVSCAMNLLVQRDKVRAIARLKEALHWRHFSMACHRPRHLAHLLEGVGLYVLGTLGAGVLAGRCSYWAHQMLKKWHLQCIE
jgi:glycosyltransferase involved in cell wall biosynthesis